MQAPFFVGLAPGEAMAKILVGLSNICYTIKYEII